MRKLLLIGGLAALLLVPVATSTAAPSAKPTTTTTAPPLPALRGYHVVEQSAEIPADYTGEWFDTTVACTSGSKPLSGAIQGLTGWAITMTFPAFPPPGGGPPHWFFRLTRIPGAPGPSGTVTAKVICAFEG